MVLPPPFGMRYEELEEALNGIAQSKSFRFSIDYAEFLVQLNLAEAPLVQPTHPVQITASPRSLVDIAMIGLQMWTEASTRPIETWKNFRLTDDGFVAYYDRFVYEDENEFKAIMRQKLSENSCVQRILNPFHGQLAMSLDGFVAHLKTEFAENIWSADVEKLLKLFERYELVELTRDRFQIRQVRISVIASGRNPLEHTTGWTRVHRALYRARIQLSQASEHEEFAQIGLLCREVLISLGQAVYDAERHPSLDGTTPSETDAKRMLEGFVAADYLGSANKQIRKIVNDAYDLANALQHHRTAAHREAALCREATTSVVNLVGILHSQLLSARLRHRSALYRTPHGRTYPISG